MSSSSRCGSLYEVRTSRGNAGHRQVERFSEKSETKANHLLDTGPLTEAIFHCGSRDVRLPVCEDGRDGRSSNKYSRGAEKEGLRETSCRIIRKPRKMNTF